MNETQFTVRKIYFSFKFLDLRHKNDYSDKETHNLVDRQLDGLGSGSHGHDWTTHDEL